LIVILPASRHDLDEDRPEFPPLGRKEHGEVDGGAAEGDAGRWRVVVETMGCLDTRLVMMTNEVPRTSVPTVG
jgi:hypothetical protein